MQKHRRTIRTLTHCYYDLKYHSVWTPKYRGKVLGNEYVKNELRRTLESISKWKGWEIMELNIQPDHIHICLLASPRYSVSYIMQIMKGKSSAWLKKKVKSKKGIYAKYSVWARGYFALTIGIDENVIKRYVRHQHVHHEINQPSLFTHLT